MNCYLNTCVILFSVLALSSGSPSKLFAKSVDEPIKDPECPIWQGYPKYLPNLQDCQRFYECSNGYKIPLICPDGLHFSVNLSVCDYPWRARCEDQSS